RGEDGRNAEGRPAPERRRRDADGQRHADAAAQPRAHGRSDVRRFDERVRPQHRGRDHDGRVGMRKVFLTAICVGALAASPTRAAGTSSVVDAAMAGNRDAVKALLQNGADVNTALGDGMTALHYAAVRNDVELARLLLYAGANLKATTRLGGYTPLLLAAKGGNASVMDALLASGSATELANSATVNGTTALMFAAQSGRVDAVK